MANRLRWIERRKAVERPFMPVAILEFPVQLQLPALLLRAIPAVIEPKQLPPVSAVIHEFLKFRVRHQPVCDREWLQELAVHRQFVVPTPAGSRVAEFIQSAVE